MTKKVDPPMCSYTHFPVPMEQIPGTEVWMCPICKRCLSFYRHENTPAPFPYGELNSPAPPEKKE